jgi:hypothetical protein
MAPRTRAGTLPKADVMVSKAAAPVVTSKPKESM